MTDDDQPIQSVTLPVLHGASMHLYASGRVTLVTSEDDGADLTPVVGDLLQLLLQAREIRREGS